MTDTKRKKKALPPTWLEAQTYERTNKEKANQVIANTATIGERIVPEDELVEVVGVVVVAVGVVIVGVVLVLVLGVPAAGVVVDALATVTATFMPLPQWPTAPQTKQRVPAVFRGMVVAPLLSELRELPTVQVLQSLELTSATVCPLAQLNTTRTTKSTKLYIISKFEVVYGSQQTSQIEHYHIKILEICKFNPGSKTVLT